MLGSFCMGELIVPIIGLSCVSGLCIFDMPWILGYHDDFSLYITHFCLSDQLSVSVYWVIQADSSFCSHDVLL